MPRDIHAGWLFTSRLAVAPAHVDDALFVAIGGATAASTAPTAGLLLVAAGPKPPAIHVDKFLVPRPRPAVLLAVPTSASLGTPRAAVAASPPPAVTPPVQAAIPRVVADAAAPVAMPRDAAEFPPLPPFHLPLLSVPLFLLPPPQPLLSSPLYK